MSRTLTFARGGVEPLDFKSLTSHLPIANAHIPAVAVVPLLQHSGAPAVAVVSPGDRVREGMLIARADGFRSANIHSPVPGLVRDVGDMTLPDGGRCRAVTVECAGEFDRSGKILNRQPWDGVDAATLNALVAEMGVVGLGGAGFPVHVKYAFGTDRPADSLIVNGIECEPYLTGEHRLMLEKPDEIIEGSCIARKITGARGVVFAVAENKIDAVAVLREKIAEKSLPFDLVTVKAKFPQGEEDLLRHVLREDRTAHHIPPGTKTIISNVGTIFAVYEAVVWKKPLIERVITISGSAVVRPSNVKARIGTKIGELFEDCGGFREPPGRIVMGGPFLGAAVTDLDAPLTKLTTGLIALTRRETASCADDACIRCGRCVRSCPWGLSPTILVKLIKHGRTEEAVAGGLNDCEECGCCAYVCPAGIPLLAYLRKGRSWGRMPTRDGAI
ncbi:MAG: electron transport complex subunit RsxC [Spirochaetales bacterium]|nr:electron transport complex subunit RsxC [Spirochaetales bacterium]